MSVPLVQLTRSTHGAPGGAASRPAVAASEAFLAQGEGARWRQLCRLKA